MSIKIQKNIPLSKYTSFKIGGPAKFFCVVENVEEIKEAVEYARENKLAVFVLGGGSNLLISDKGFDGLVIRITNYELRIKNNEIFVGSGLSLAKLVSESVKNNFTGLEWAAGIPGTVGGAIVNNAGAYGKCMGDVVESVEILEYKTPSFKKRAGMISKTGITNYESRIAKLNNKQCNFSYRNSLFKKEKKYIVLNAILKLSKGKEVENRKMILEILKSRKEKQPLEYPSAGSIFKNPVIENEHLKKLVKKYPELSTMEIQPRYTIPVGWFIEELGLKGKKIGGAMISEKHGNFIVNINNAKAEDIIILTSLIKQKVRDNFGVQLKEEIEYVGF
ncbi:MAG: UDP-N-acetylmuramate dehydrogenase [Patescibacteria group bacterium]|nr:UDP-N-acetylmuramate dehydrogenase [Patescibacteria group bacterium]